MSASDNLSTKCSGLLLRSSFAILAARARHLFSAAPMPALSVASRQSNSSDIMPPDRRSLWRTLERGAHSREIKKVSNGPAHQERMRKGGLDLAISGGRAEAPAVRP